MLCVRCVESSHAEFKERTHLFCAAAAACVWDLLCVCWLLNAPLQLSRTTRSRPKCTNHVPTLADHHTGLGTKMLAPPLIHTVSAFKNPKRSALRRRKIGQSGQGSSVGQGGGDTKKKKPHTTHHHPYTAASLHSPPPCSMLASLEPLTRSFIVHNVQMVFFQLIACSFLRAVMWVAAKAGGMRWASPPCSFV